MQSRNVSAFVLATCSNGSVLHSSQEKALCLIWILVTILVLQPHKGFVFIGSGSAVTVVVQQPRKGSVFTGSGSAVTVVVLQLKALYLLVLDLPSRLLYCK